MPKVSLKGCKRPQIILIIAAAALIAAILLYWPILQPAQPGAGQGAVETAEQRLYKDAEYSFEISCPPDWGFEKKTDDRGVNTISFSPSGGQPVLRIYAFEGSPNQYTDLFPPFGLFGIAEEEPLKKFYAFKKPGREEWLIIADESALATGASDAQKSELKETVEKIISTLMFVD